MFFDRLFILNRKMNTENTLDNILNSKYRDLLVSLPTDIAWIGYIQSFIDLKVNSDYFEVQVTGTPKTREEKRCYLVFEDEVKGWMYIKDVESHGDITMLRLIPYLYTIEPKMKIQPFVGFKYWIELSGGEKQ